MFCASFHGPRTTGQMRHLSSDAGCARQAGTHVPRGAAIPSAADSPPPRERVEQETEEAERIRLRTSRLPPQQSHRSPLARIVAAFFEPELRAWQGAAPLGRVFWGSGVSVSAVFATLYVLAIYEGRVVARQLMLMCFAAYTLWILVSVWRCAATADPFWGLLARWLTVAWAGNASLVLFFLQLDLMGLYLGQ